MVSRKIMRKTPVWLIFACGLTLFSNNIFADDYLTTETNIIKERIAPGGKLLCAPKLPCAASGTLATFYKQRHFNPAWIEDEALSQAGKQIVEMLRTAYADGLDPRNYHTRQINSLLSQLNTSDDKGAILANLDMTVSDGFLLYLNNIYYGTLDTKKVYPYWTGVKKPIDLVKQLDLAIVDPQKTVEDLMPTYPGYAKLKDKLAEYQEVEANGGWQTIPDGDTLAIGDKGDRVKALQQRLIISGEYTGAAKGKFDDALQKAVMQFQENNGLYDDGIVESDTLAALNISTKMRIRLIELNLDKMRMLPQDMSKDFLFVNLPSYTLNVVHDGKQFLNMDVAVGGGQHPSCVLNSKIQYLVLNPYWNIPAQIAESEIWASVKKDPDYLRTKHVQVLKKNSNGDYKEINVDDFNWNKMSARQFNSYRYRQAPCEENALGKVKFIFPNACGIYLHSTNESELFDVYARDFSHGCIRVNQPLNLTTFILNSQKQWSSKKVADMYDNDINKTVQLVRPFNLYIMYLTAFVDDDGWAQFRRDIYHFDKLSNYNGFMPKKVTVESGSD